MKQLQFLSIATMCLLISCSEKQQTTEKTTDVLSLNLEDYKLQHLVIDGDSLTFRAYENITYVKNPVDTVYQKMNIYIPEGYFSGATINDFTAQTAPIFFPNQVGGYMPATPGTAIAKQGQFSNPGSNRITTIAKALQQGFVVASPGARGRTTMNTSGVYTGKAPAVIVDLKAAVRYLKYNDENMPGDAEKIISNGTSAGGAVSALLGASGNNKNYLPYLKELGAAEATDAIFAVSAYCPITNLEHADMAYEWQFNSVTDFAKMNFANVDGQIKREMVKGSLNSKSITVSNELKSQFPAYVNSLKLTDANGKAIILNEEGKGSFLAYIQEHVISSAQHALENGTDMSPYPFLTIQNNVVMKLDFEAYVLYMTRLKTPPAFDALDLSAPENQEFGTNTIDKQHFTSYAQAHTQVEGSTVASKDVIALMNPLTFIGKHNSDIAPYFRVRHGTKDSDTSLAISAILSLALQNQHIQVDYKLPWDKPHSGDYDLEELFLWMKHISTENHPTFQ